jgi:lysophospholipase L1-like esterase
VTRTIVCFGDSNTHGANPSGHGAEPKGPARLPRAQRWPRVLEATLGHGYDIIEEGLNGRCTIWDSEIEPGRNGLAYLGPCLRSHAPVDLITIMLGTNDLKRIYGNTAAEIACGAARLVDEARGTLSGPGGSPPEVLLIAPVPLGPITARSALWGFGEAIETSRQLASMYAIVAEDHGAGFFDAGSVAAVHPDDGVHLDAAACERLGRALAPVVRAQLEG